MSFPKTRLRRLRVNASMRALVRENTLIASNLLLPIFVKEGDGRSEPIEAIPGHNRVSIQGAVEISREAEGLGISGVLLFGIPLVKDEQGSAAWDSEGVVQQAVRAIRVACPSLLVITDVCLCQYTSHGHCGVLTDNSAVDNDETVELLARVAVSHAEAGAHIIAPSDMMDKRVESIRIALDEQGFTDTAIMSYSSKFASAYYGPFREAAHSTPESGDRKTYQMDPANSLEAVRESEFDASEGADILMVKPALSYLDVLYQVKQATRLPLAAYSVSGEYAMIKAAAEKGWINEREVQLETLLSMRRAGADMIITYAALEAARWLSE